jgi:hypothetical protein
MKGRILFLTVILGLLTTVAAGAPAWIPFFKQPSKKSVWVYNREEINYFKEKQILGFIPVKDRNFPTVWFKSIQPDKERRLVIEMDCSGRTGRLSDDRGNVLYADNEVEFMFGHPFKPDSVLAALYQEVCTLQVEKGKDQTSSPSPPKSKQ